MPIKSDRFALEGWRARAGRAQPCPKPKGQGRVPKSWYLQGFWGCSGGLPLPALSRCYQLFPLLVCIPLLGSPGGDGHWLAFSTGPSVRFCSTDGCPGCPPSPKAFRGALGRGREQEPLPGGREPVTSSRPGAMATR